MTLTAVTPPQLDVIYRRVSLYNSHDDSRVTSKIYKPTELIQLGSHFRIALQRHRPADSAAAVIERKIIHIA
ncbi:Hypothetical protein NTJ_04756 [Nesidiocoris tenuis]|uniref:Uncharacterized protein n=1 Tax=Nesidiocoris tenuis TaxID=355587 RepID=A0ABN7AI51_9HEMI|nr:Hypothetical protein NTJ_04756 [Nesidiocoris tenuis]